MRHDIRDGNAEQLHTQSGVDLKSVCRSLLKIIARLEGNEHATLLLPER